MQKIRKNVLYAIMQKLPSYSEVPNKRTPTVIFRPKKIHPLRFYQAPFYWGIRYKSTPYAYFQVRKADPPTLIRPPTAIRHLRVCFNDPKWTEILLVYRSSKKFAKYHFAITQIYCNFFITASQNTLTNYYLFTLFDLAEF